MALEKECTVFNPENIRKYVPGVIALTLLVGTPEATLANNSVDDCSVEASRVLGRTCRNCHDKQDFPPLVGMIEKEAKKRSMQVSCSLWRDDRFKTLPWMVSLALRFKCSKIPHISTASFPPKMIRQAEQFAERVLNCALAQMSQSSGRASLGFEDEDEQLEIEREAERRKQAGKKLARESKKAFFEELRN